MRSARWRRRGITLVEGMVASAVAMVLFVSISDLFFRGSSLLESSHAHVEAATGAQLLVERIHADLRRAASSDPAALGSAGPPITVQVRTEAGGIEGVTYETVPGPVDGTLQVSRNGRVLPAVLLKQLVIRPLPVTSGGGTTIYGYQVLLLATDSSGGTDYPLVSYTAADVPTLQGALDPYWVPNGG